MKRQRRSWKLLPISSRSKWTLSAPPRAFRIKRTVTLESMFTNRLVAHYHWYIRVSSGFNDITGKSVPPMVVPFSSLVLSFEPLGQPSSPNPVFGSWPARATLPNGTAAISSSPIPSPSLIFTSSPLVSNQPPKIRRSQLLRGELRSSWRCCWTSRLHF